MPMSTISLESTFSLTGRIIEERRRRLALETVEMLSCIKDWEAGDARAQHFVEDKELEAAFDDLYLDVYLIMYSCTWTLEHLNYVIIKFD